MFPDDTHYSEESVFAAGPAVYDVLRDLLVDLLAGPGGHGSTAAEDKSNHARFYGQFLTLFLFCKILIVCTLSCIHCCFWLLGNQNKNIKKNLDICNLYRCCSLITVFFFFLQNKFSKEYPIIRHPLHQ